jgi:hypothetical protein
MCKLVRPLPEGIMRHLDERIREREMSEDDMRSLALWVLSDPDVPERDWVKRFPRITVVGRGGYVLTFLRPDQAAIGTEI